VSGRWPVYVDGGLGGWVMVVVVGRGGDGWRMHIHISGGPPVPGVDVMAKAPQSGGAGG
jgi:hypothetical protein